MTGPDIVQWERCDVCGVGHPPHPEPPVAELVAGESRLDRAVGWALLAVSVALLVWLPLTVAWAAGWL